MFQPSKIQSLLILAVALCLVPNVTNGQVRKLAPGVLTVIPSEPKDEETFQGPLPLMNITQQNWDPPYTPRTQTLREKASQVTLRRNIWNLEFAFKPVRMIHVDIPQTSGKMRQKLIWYMVYRVKNNGRHLTPVPQKDNFGHTTYATTTVDEVLNYTAQRTGVVYFFPNFVLRSHDENKEYLDRIIPVAIPLIQQRETQGAKLLNSVEISNVGVPVSAEGSDKSVWGVVTWEDVDPRTDFFSIYVQGLTNAFRIQATAKGVAHLQKTLQLNFWRPSDPVDEHELEIRYGVPAVTEPAEQARVLSQYGLRTRVDHLWIYR